MSTDFSEIMAAMSSVPDIIIDPNSGTTIGSTGKTLGDKYQMEGKVSPKIAEKIRENRVIAESEKEHSRSMVDAYKEMVGVPTSTQIKEQHQKAIEEREQALAEFQAQRNSQAIMEAHFQELIGHNKEIDQLNEEFSLQEQTTSQDPMMDMYVNSINKKLKWSKK